MDKPKVTPKDFVLWVGAMATLYSGVFAFISLVFDYINQLFPNPITNSYTYYDPYQTGNISYEMAALIVLTPVFLILMRAIRADIARDSSRREVWVRRWALFLTLALAAGTMVIDLIVLLTYYLQGEDLTIGFLLKVLAAPLRTHDMDQVAHLHPELQTGDVLIADRGFCSFAHFALLVTRKLHGLFRAHQKSIISFRPGRDYNTPDCRQLRKRAMRQWDK